MTDAPPIGVLDEAAWRERERRHKDRVAPWIEPRLRRKSRGERHPVYDFLFEYYSYRPGQLSRWHPGIGLLLAGSGAEEFLELTHYERFGNGIGVSPRNLKPERRAFVRWLLDLLNAIDARPPFFGCAGLHEWAMVYRTDELRHSEWPLRLSPAEIAAVVEQLPIRCSHYDAFRFFTPKARPLNRFQPSRETTVALEQAGCLHANMDLYKWASKLVPFAPSELVADTFALALEIREIDMRASPYDFTALGFAPIPIETPEGRALYERFQRDFAFKATPVRARLKLLCEKILAFEI